MEFSTIVIHHSLKFCLFRSVCISWNKVLLTIMWPKFLKIKTGQYADEVILYTHLKNIETSYSLNINNEQTFVKAVKVSQSDESVTVTWMQAKIDSQNKSYERKSKQGTMYHFQRERLNAFWISFWPQKIVLGSSPMHAKDRHEHLNYL